jgi:hypothetical protein
MKKIKYLSFILISLLFLSFKPLEMRIVNNTDSNIYMKISYDESFSEFVGKNYMCKKIFPANDLLIDIDSTASKAEYEIKPNSILNLCCGLKVKDEIITCDSISIKIKNDR